MKVSKAQAAENHERILETASRLFREKGFDGVGVAELMKAAGLTNGAFYGHFASKDDLIAKACQRVLTSGADPWRELVDGAPLDRFVTRYLSPRHVASPGEGCLFAALGGDVARQSPPARRAFTESLRARIEAVARAVRGPDEATRRRRALADVSAMVGALMLARAVDDLALSGELLDAVSERVIGEAT